MVDVTSFTDFSSAARAVLAFLRAQVGLDVWAVGRWDGERWVALEVSENSVGVIRGAVIPWGDTLCSRMVDGRGPRIAPRVDAVDAYGDAPARHVLQAAAYVGTPLRRHDGTLFGTLCGLSTSEQDDALHAHGPLVTLLASLLSTQIEWELTRSTRQRAMERAAVPGLVDRATGFWNRTGFELMLENEEARCSRFGHSAAVMTIHVHPGSDDRTAELSRDASSAVLRLLRRLVRAEDIVARVSEREFAVLAVECDRHAADALLTRTRTHAAESELLLGLGFARRDPAYGLPHAWTMSQRSVVRAA